jgi:hypothetical protein
LDVKNIFAGSHTESIAGDALSKSSSPTFALAKVARWVIIMIGPGGLLLVVPHLFAVLVSISWVGGLQERK